MDGQERWVNCIGRSEERTHLLRKPQKVGHPRACERIEGRPPASYGVVPADPPDVNRCSHSATNADIRSLMRL